MGPPPTGESVQLMCRIFTFYMERPKGWPDLAAETYLALIQFKAGEM
jgi:hypothetical protein